MPQPQQLSPAAMAAAQAKLDEERDVCLRASKLVHGGARAEEYGDVTQSFTRIARHWSNLFGHHVSEHQVMLAMILFKVAREQYKHNEDNLVDICGYAECGSIMANHWKDVEASMDAAFDAAVGKPRSFKPLQPSSKKKRR